MAIAAPAASTEENGMGIDVGSRAERGRRPAKSFSFLNDFAAKK